jgi:NADH-quinone oxidoreductase subunit B
MKASGYFVTTMGKVLEWARANALWYMSTGANCCADELICTEAARFDLSRFGALPQVDPVHADLLIIQGAIPYKAAGYLRELYDSMLAPKYVMAIGSCATCGGPFAPEYSYSVIPGADRVVPVDIYVSGCPPRPEAVMNGLLTLQKRIRGNQGLSRAT